MKEPRNLYTAEREVGLSVRDHFRELKNKARKQLRANYCSVFKWGYEIL